jgi:hypothetical protein
MAVEDVTAQHIMLGRSPEVGLKNLVIADLWCKGAAGVRGESIVLCPSWNGGRDLSSFCPRTALSSTEQLQVRYTHMQELTLL